MAGSGSAIKEGDLEPMCFQLIDFQMVAKLTVPGPFQPHRPFCETGTKKGKTFRFFLGSSGGRTRTCDLRVMSPTSYRLLYLAVLDCKGTAFFCICKFFSSNRHLVRHPGKETSLRRSLVPALQSVLQLAQRSIGKDIACAAIFRADGIDDIV